MSFKKVSIIVNPISGGRDKREIGELIKKHIDTVYLSSTVYFTSARGDAATYAKNSVESKCDLVVAVGGDGTINEIATELIHSNVVLAIIPMGSGNGFARSLEIPLDIENACELIHSGVVRAIDVGKVNERYFFLLAGIGFDAVVGKAFEEHNHRGPLPYFYLSAKEFFNYRPKKNQVFYSGENRELATFQLTVANGKQYGNNFYIAPDAIMNDGLLNISIIHRLPFHRLFTQLPKMFFGRMDNMPDTDFFTSSYLKIIKSENSVINVDGEVIDASTELEFSVISKSLKMITPILCSCLK